MKFLDMIKYIRIWKNLGNLKESEIKKNIFIYNYIETYIIGYTLFYFAEFCEKC